MLARRGQTVWACHANIDLLMCLLLFGSPAGANSPTNLRNKTVVIVLGRPQGQQVEVFVLNTEEHCAQRGRGEVVWQSLTSL